MSETLDLDAIAAWFEGKTEHSTIDDLSVIPEWHAVRDLIAEVRRLREDREMGRTNLAHYSDIIDAQAGEIETLLAQVESREAGA